MTGKRLVIVESPAKAKTIAGYLGKDFVVESSVGHIRDLPERAADIPAEYKKEKWSRLGVNVENDFEPLYVVDPDKKKKVSELKKLLKDADELLLATDEDREGEAIAWHLNEVLSPKVPVKRMVFHEITKDAIDRALQQTRDIDERLVNAQILISLYVLQNLVNSARPLDFNRLRTRLRTEPEVQPLITRRKIAAGGCHGSELRTLGRYTFDGCSNRVAIALVSYQLQSQPMILRFRVVMQDICGAVVSGDDRVQPSIVIKVANG